MQLEKKHTKGEWIKAWKNNKYRYLMLLPAILAVFVFCYLPFLGISIAFKDFDIIEGFSGSEWVGLKNFSDIFASADIWNTVLRTLKYSFVLLFVTFPFPIILALMFNELNGKNFKKVAQTLTYLPHFLSMITVVGLFYSLLSTNGTINTLLEKVMGDSYVKKNILIDSKYFLSIIFSANLWKEVGWSSVIFIAAIAGVDRSLYEAAAVDGCGRLRQAWYITLPGIASTIIIIFIMQFGNIFNAGFELVYGFQNLYTQNDTDIISTVIYRSGIVNGDYSHATAFGLAQGLVSIVLVYAANLVSKKISSVSIW